MALVGWVVGQSEEKVPSWVIGMMGGTVCMVLVAFVWVSILSREMFHITQGRYLFPILVPYAFLLVGGLERLFAARVWRYVAALFLLFLVCFDTLCLAGYILPRYY